MTEQPIAITGIGAVSGWGWGVEPLRRGLWSGVTAIGPFDRFDTGEHRTRVASQAPPEPREPSAPAPRPDGEARRRSLADRFAVAAAREAVAAAGGASALAPSTGVYFGGSTAGMLESEELFHRHLAQHGTDRTARTARADAQAPPLPGLGALTAQPINNPADAVARDLGTGGPVVTVSSACASGTQALGLALDALRSGDCEVALAGGGDSLCQLTYAGFNALRVVDPVPCRPFRESRAGMSLGDGAGVLVLEPLERARARGAKVLGLLLGVGNSCDAHHMTAPHPEGTGAALAVRRALADAGLEAGAVDFINAHGTGTPLNDASERAGFARVFGDRLAELPVTATKASVGHLLGSSGAIEAVATVLCFEAGEIHPTPPAAPGSGSENPGHAGDDRGDPGAAGIDPDAIDPDAIDPDAIDRDAIVRLVLAEPLAAPGARLALSTSFGFGGANAAAVLAHPGYRAPGDRP